jgi:siroheme synthase (precorrin-2 oxidase/ferrochelatase)
MRNLQPLFLDLVGREVLLVGGGRVAAGKLRQLLTAGACVRVVSPLVLAEIDSMARRVDHEPGDAGNVGDQPGAPMVHVVRRSFQDADVDGVWLVVAAATPDVNRQVARAAERRRVFVNAVDDPGNATAYLSGVVRRDDVTIAISTSGDAPGLTALVREALDAVLPADIGDWVATARRVRVGWRRNGVPMEARKPLLLRALNHLYEVDGLDRIAASGRIPWLSGPEDSWL